VATLAKTVFRQTKAGTIIAGAGDFSDQPGRWRYRGSGSTTNAAYGGATAIAAGVLSRHHGDFFVSAANNERRRLAAVSHQAAHLRAHLKTSSHLRRSWHHCFLLTFPSAARLPPFRSAHVASFSGRGMTSARLF